MDQKPLNIFYEEPDPDRWIKYDRYPRRIIRRLVRGKQPPGGVETIFINLIKGFNKTGIPYRINDYKYILNHPEEIACILGKPHVLFEKKWPNPIIFGAGVYSHPVEFPDLIDRYPNIKRFLVPGKWMQEMFAPYYGEKVLSWPVGIDTQIWSPSIKTKPRIDFLIYDKIRWNYEHVKTELIDPICSILDQRSLSYQFVKYGYYNHPKLIEKLKESRNAIFLCEHETQGLAYQQILSTGTPILAWESDDYWRDPYYFPEKVKFRPVSAVPYWDDRCGLKFSAAKDFKDQLIKFESLHQTFNPRAYVEENLSLEKCALTYNEIYLKVLSEI